MRAVCFVKRLEFDFSGNVFRHALCLGDVDNDGELEMIVGNANGEVSVFKSQQCWQKITGLGMITAIGVGDVMNCGSNALVIISGDGWCHIYLSLKSNTEQSSDDESNTKLESVHVQRIPPNTKVMVLDDVEGDGNTEMVLGLTDRVVRSYRWQPCPTTGGRLVCLNKWECANQIGTLTLHQDPDEGGGEEPCLLVSQPGGTYMKIRCCQGVDQAEGQTSSGGDMQTAVDYHPLLSSQLRNPNISTEILGNIATRPDRTGVKCYAVATLDGTLMLGQQDTILWCYQQWCHHKGTIAVQSIGQASTYHREHLRGTPQTAINMQGVIAQAMMLSAGSIHVANQLFALNKLDLTGDGSDEIIACSWDGQTYILDQQRNCVCFPMEEPVAAFCAGLYTLERHASPSPCLIYTTFTNKIYVYYDVKIPRMVPCSLSSLVRESNIMESICPGVELTKEQLRGTIQYCLYAHKSPHESSNATQ